MKLSITASALARAVDHAKDAVERRGTIPILSNVLLDAGDGAVAISATDMDLWVSESVRAEVIRPGCVTLSAHALAGFLASVGAGAVIDIEYDPVDAVAIIRCGRARANLPTLPADEFPVWTKGAALTHRFTIPAAAFVAMMARTAFAIARDEQRYYLNGIFLHLAGAGELRMAATDGHRLAIVTTPPPEGCAGMPGIIIPHRTVKLLTKAIEAGKGHGADLTLELGDTALRLTQGQMVVSSKVIDGTFPDYTRVIPTDNDKPLEMTRAEITATVSRVVSIMDDRTRAVKLTAAAGALRLTASSPDSGTCAEEMEIPWRGAPIEIGFNSRFLLDAIQRLTGDTVRLTLADPTSPALITDPADDAATYVLMPMRV